MADETKTTMETGWLLQRERAVAWLRVAFALLAVLVIYLNPERVARFPMLSFFSLKSFLLYSVVVLYLSQRKPDLSSRTGFLTTALDVVWIAVIVFSTGGTRTPFFFYYSFPVITASVRWGLKGSIPVALVGVVVYGTVRITLAAEAMESPIGIDTLLVRSMYLIVLAAIFGYISEFEKKQNERLLALSKTAGEVATLKERRRIMFELHDGILQSLATLILRLESCRARLADSQQSLTEELKSVEDLIRDSMRQIRQFLAGKEPLPFTGGSLIEKLRHEARFLRDGMGLDVILESRPEELDLSPATEREVYYVLREALTNVTRHSHASKVEIQLTQTDGTLEGSLTDNGVGFNYKNLDERKGFGLSGMEQRIKKIGGELFVKSSPGKGTRLAFAVPLGVRSDAQQ
ncbi:MAG TPA: sensor histidine kinase [Candidatus Binatia bacterium]|nr:sensor histidine kinase [Candidatus Binatia bacterium]